MQCVELEAALRHQQEAYSVLEGQLSGSRQKGKELQVRSRRAWLPRLSLPHVFVRAGCGISFPAATTVFERALTEARQLGNGKRGGCNVGAPSQTSSLHLQRTHLPVRGEQEMRRSGAQALALCVRGPAHGAAVVCKGTCAPVSRRSSVARVKPEPRDVWDAGAAADEPGGAQALGGAAARCAAGARGLGRAFPAGCLIWWLQRDAPAGCLI